MSNVYHCEECRKEYICWKEYLPASYTEPEEVIVMPDQCPVCYSYLTEGQLPADESQSGDKNNFYHSGSHV